MTDDGVDPSIQQAIRQAIGGDLTAISWIAAHADSSDHAVLIAMAALLEGHPGRLDHASTAATTSGDRQVVAIVRAHLDGDNELVDALARDHLVDNPGSVIVAWIASGAAARWRREGAS